MYTPLKLRIWNSYIVYEGHLQHKGLLISCVSFVNVSSAPWGRTLRPQDVFWKGIQKKAGPLRSVKLNKGSNDQRHTSLAATCPCPSHSSTLLRSLSVEFLISFKGLKEHRLHHFLILNQLHEQSNFQCVAALLNIPICIHHRSDCYWNDFRYFSLFFVLPASEDENLSLGAFHYNGSGVRINNKAARKLIQLTSERYVDSLQWIMQILSIENHFSLVCVQNNTSFRFWWCFIMIIIFRFPSIHPSSLAIFSFKYVFFWSSPMEI